MYAFYQGRTEIFPKREFNDNLSVSVDLDTYRMAYVYSSTFFKK
jgi:hypothetical protein